MKILSEKLLITTVNAECVKRTVSNRNISDFEDGLEYYSAEGSGCTMIITENQKDFYFSKMNVTNCEAFFINYMEA